MRRFTCGIVLGALSWIVAGGAISAEPSYTERAASYLSRVTSPTTAGIAVLVAKDGKVVYQGGYGNADLEAKTPVTVETKFRIGSITKQFTAVAILQLVEAGKLNLDDPVTKHLPEFKAGANVTLRQLLTHTSGLHSYTEKPEFFTRVEKPIEPAKLIEWFQDDPQDFAPGQGFHYCNTGYFLLGEVVARVSGMPYAEYLRKHVLDPFEMRDSGVYENASVPSNMAKGYSYLDDKYQPALDWDMSWAGGAGAMYSTVGDLFKWNEALFNGRVLKPETFKAATTPVELPPDVDGMKYGFGLMRYDVKRLPAIGHGGGLNGWCTDLLRLPEQRCTVVVLTNALPSQPELQPGVIAQLLAEKLHAEEIAKMPPPEEDKSVDPKTFQAYVGRYDYNGAIMTVTVKEEGLFAQLTGQENLQIYPRGNDEFFWKVVEAQVKFMRDEKGIVKSVRHTQGGNSFTALKLGDDVMELTDEELAGIVGKYQYGPTAVLQVTREGKQLFAQLTGQPRFPIFPKSKEEFEWRVVKAKVLFIRGADGKVDHAQHHQNGNTFDAPKIE